MSRLLAMLRAMGAEFISLERALADPMYEHQDTYSGPKGLSWLYRISGTEYRMQSLREWDDSEAERLRRAIRSLDLRVERGTSRSTR